MAQIYFQQALKKATLLENNYFRILSLSGLAKVSFQQKNPQKSLFYLNQAKNDVLTLKNIYIEDLFYKQLNINFLALKDSINYKAINFYLLEIKNKIVDKEQVTLNTVYNVISEEQNLIFLNQKIRNHSIIYMVLGISGIVLLLFGAVYFLHHQRKKNLKEIIYYLNITRKNNITKVVEKIVAPKKSTVPKETEDFLLQKLSKFEQLNKFTNKDVSLALLASQFETNTKYLSEVISSNYQVNFNTYINTLRVNYIIEKLKNDPNYINYKISYLAENSGFSSHSAFATLFKSITGISPVTFINLLKKEKEEQLSHEA